MREILIAMLFLQQGTLAGLIPAAETIVVAEISATDYSRTPSDGPMTAKAKVLKAVKGGLKNDQSFEFTETAWVGPNYRTGEVRILFLESNGRNSWRILSDLHARLDFIIARDAIPDLNPNSLKSALEKLSAPSSGSILISKDMLR